MRRRQIVWLFIGFMSCLLVVVVGGVRATSPTADTKRVLVASATEGHDTLSLMRVSDGATSPVQFAMQLWDMDAGDWTAKYGIDDVITTGLAVTAVTPGTYNHVTLTVNEYGQLTAASHGTTYTLSQVIAQGNNAVGTPVNFATTATVLTVGNKEINGDLGVTGDLDVDGAGVIDGNLNVGAGVDVTGSVTVTVDVDVTGDVDVGDDLQVTDDTVIGGDLQVTGDIVTSVTIGVSAHRTSATSYDFGSVLVGGWSSPHAVQIFSGAPNNGPLSYTTSASDTDIHVDSGSTGNVEGYEMAEMTYSITNARLGSQVSRIIISSTDASNSPISAWGSYTGYTP